MFEAMLNGEMDNHLGYASNDHGAKTTENRRNGYIEKTVRTSGGNIEIRSPRDRDGSFDPQVIPKHSRDVSSIEDKVLAMYARGTESDNRRIKKRPRHQSGQAEKQRKDSGD